MALTTYRARYVAVLATRYLLGMRDKNCCTVCSSNLTPKRSICSGTSDVDDKPDYSNTALKTIIDSKYPLTVKEKKILMLLISELGLEQEMIQNEILKHPKRKHLTLNQIQRSLNYLLGEGFSKEVIADLPATCFYPQENIKTALQKITENSVELRKLGFENGILQNETPGFLRGSKLKDKRLHLCVYYMESPFHFSGSGIFNFDESSDACKLETEQ